MITLSIPEATPSLNAVNRMHWSRRNRLRGEWQWLVKAEVLNRKIHVKASEHANVTITRYGPRVLDHDNLVGGAKQIVDSLVWEGFLIDDTPAHLTTTYVQHIGKPSRTVVRIETV